MPKHRIDKPDLPSLGPLSILSDKERGILQFYGDFNEHEPEAVIIRQNAPQESLYFVIEGTLEALRGKDNTFIVLGSIGAGDWFGEINMLDPQQEASASVVVKEPARLWSISRDQLQAYLNDYPEEGCGLLISLAATLSRRARDLLLQLRQVNLAEHIFSSTEG